MANGEHLARLKEGVHTWNAWRKAHRGMRIDLSGTNLRIPTLSHTILNGDWAMLLSRLCD